MYVWSSEKFGYLVQSFYLGTALHTGCFLVNGYEQGTCMNDSLSQLATLANRGKILYVDIVNFFRLLFCVKNKGGNYQY